MYFQNQAMLQKSLPFQQRSSYNHTSPNPSREYSHVIQHQSFPSESGDTLYKFFFKFISTCQRRMNEIITNTVVSLNNGTNKFNQELKEHKIICWKTNIDCNIAIEKLQKVITEKKEQERITRIEKNRKSSIKYQQLEAKKRKKAIEEGKLFTNEKK